MFRVISPSELQSASDKELCVLFNKLSEQLYASTPGSAEARATLTSLDNVRREVAGRARTPRPPGF